jgi:two-component system OmpR family sensor kinase
MFHLDRLNKSFRAKLLLFHVLLWSVLFAGTGAVVYHIVYQRLETKMGEQLLAIARLVARQLAPRVPAQIHPDFFDKTSSRVLAAQLGSFLQSGVLENIILLDRQGAVLLDAAGEAVPGFKSGWLKDEKALLDKGGLTPGVLPLRKSDFGLLHQSVLLPLNSALFLEVDADPRYLEVLSDFTRYFLVLGFLGLCVSGLAGVFLAQRVLQPLNLVFEMSEEIMRGEYPHSDGAVRKDELGRWVRLMQAMFRKIHNRERELAHLRRKAENQAEEMKMVAAGIAHEVRNPLGVIQGQADRLQKKAGHLDPDLLAAAQKIQSQVRNMNNVVTRFLDYSRTFQLNRLSFQLPDLLTRISQDIAELALKQKVEILLDLGPCENLHADWSLFYNSFYNLGLNSIQAMPQGGILIFRLRQILNKALVEVEDSGPGIAPENLPQLFKPFFSTKTEGTGLGLAFTEKVFQAHGGQIAALNRPEGGAVFRIILPLQEEFI